MALTLLALAACGPETAVPSPEENTQMDDAANLLNQAPADLEAVDDGGLDPEVGNEL